MPSRNALRWVWATNRCVYAIAIYLSDQSVGHRQEHNLCSEPSPAGIGSNSVCANQLLNRPDSVLYSSTASLSSSTFITPFLSLSPVVIEPPTTLISFCMWSLGPVPAPS